MATKGLRVFYSKIDNLIVGTHELQAPEEKQDAKFPNTVENDLTTVPDKPQLNATGSVVLDGNGNLIKLGGVPEDYACIEELDSQRASDLLASDENSIVDGKLVIGAKRIVPVIYQYEVFSKEITHPKLLTTRYLDYEVLEFNQELTAAEINELRTILGKTIRKLE